MEGVFSSASVAPAAVEPLQLPEDVVGDVEAVPRVVPTALEILQLGQKGRGVGVCGGDAAACGCGLHAPEGG